MAKTILGKVSLIPRGAYVATEVYNRLDLVSYGGSSFIVLKDGIKGITPVADNINYMLSAKEGGKGDTGSIDNLDTVVVAFTEATTRTNVETGDTIAVLFGKVKKWFTDLKALAFKDKVDWLTDIDNKPTIPAAQVSSDWNASSGVAQILNKPTNVSQFTNDSAFQTPTQVNTAVSNHNTSETAHNDIRTEIASVRLVAEGALVGYAFDTVAAMNTWIGVAANKAKLKVGNSLFIRALGVPDYWWDGESALPVEGEKVDLSGYLLSSVAANTYVSKETGKGLSTNDFTNEYKSYIDFMFASQTLTSVVSIPSLAANTEVSISANAALSIANPENLKSGYVMTIRINNTAATGITVTLPSSSNWINDYGTTLNIDASSRAEVSVWCYKTGHYSIRVGEV